MPAGRPQKTLEDLLPNWKETILDLASRGMSDVEIRNDLSIGHNMWYKLQDRNKEFGETIKKAKDICEAWWLTQGRTSLRDKEFSYVGWYMNMKNRFGWKDRNETDITSKGDKIGTVDIDKLATELKKKFAESGEMPDR